MIGSFFRCSLCETHLGYAHITLICDSDAIRLCSYGSSGRGHRNNRRVPRHRRNECPTEHHGHGHST